MIFYLILLLTLNSCLKSNNHSEKISRIVSLSPAATEIIYSLNSENKLVGVTSYCNYPEDVKNKIIVGNFSNPSIEKILSLKPDLIILAGKGQGIVDRRLKELKLRTYLYEVKKLEDIPLNIKKLGKILGKEERAKILIRKFNKKIQKFEKASSRVSKKKAFIELNLKPLYTCGRKSFLNEVLNLSGFKNLAENFNFDYFKVDPEWILKERPDFIILTSCKKKEFLNIYPVFKNFKIIDDINPDILIRPSLRILEGIKRLREKIYEK